MTPCEPKTSPDQGLDAASNWFFLGIGVLLLVEALTAWVSTGLPLGVRYPQALLASVCGIGIGDVGNLLGVAGGELIVLGAVVLTGCIVVPFGVPVGGGYRPRWRPRG